MIPSSMSQRQRNQIIPQFVKEKQQWIHNSLEKLHQKNSNKPTIEPIIKQCVLPRTIALPSIAQCFDIQYLPSTASPVLYYTNKEQLEIKGDINNKTPIFSLLEDFFKDHAKWYLAQKLALHSQQTGLPYKRLTVRAQKTRWGSCSAKKNINLNYRLLFLTEDLMDYVLLHELAHTQHMNHSKTFWDYLQTLIADARDLDKQLSQAENDLPCWCRFS